jgi:cytochrome c556
VLSLRNKVRIPAILFVFVLFLANCSDNNEKQNAEKTTVDSCAKKVNPNGDSELSVLMREMMSSASNMREMVKAGNLPEKFPEAFLKIHTAQPTDPETKKASYNGFAENYISNLQALYNSPKEDLTKNYNAVVNSCAGCHSQHCPGPLNAINKLKIE